MNAKRKRSVRTSPTRDEAPEITANWIKGADLHHGSKLVRRGRLQLATGLGWQTRMVEMLGKSTSKIRKHAV